LRSSIILTLSSVLFKSFFRASRRGKVNIVYTQPRIILILDLIAILTPFILISYLLQYLPNELTIILRDVAQQALVGLPIMLTSAIIVAGLMFELGQSAGLSSSEPVNWLPVSPREYVAASALSVIVAYSPIFTLCLGVTLPLALKFDLMHAWPASALLSVIALLLGAFVLEILRAVMNRVSSTVYRRSGKVAVVSRLLLLVVLFVMVQLAFNPLILYQALGVIVGGVEAVWFIPMIWPSVAVMDFVKLEMLPAIMFSALSVAFALLIFELGSNLRLRYWSPAPVSITLKSSTEYVPQSIALPRFMFKPLEAAIALKDFRALIRRRDMARFLAIPVIMAVSFILPTLLVPAEESGSYPGFFSAGFIPFMIPLMLSMISVGQEGRGMVNICMLPISTWEFMRGKLLPAWIISGLATIGVVLVLGAMNPMGTSIMAATTLASLLIVVIEGFIGLGVGSRYPDYTVSARARYVTIKGFIIGLLVGGAAALTLFTPLALHIAFSQGLVPVSILDLPITILILIVIGSALSYFAYRYCKGGVESLLSNLEI
jgi:hypothetical protein